MKPKKLSSYTIGSKGIRSLYIEPPSGTPLYSAYTGNFVQNYPMFYGVKNDAPIGDPRYKKDFHGIALNEKTGDWMVHDWQSMKKIK